MSVFWKKIEFDKGKSDCKAIVFATWGLGESSSGLLRGKDPKHFGFSMSLRRLNDLKWHEKNLFMA